jgi:hypothetical protein
VGELGSSPAAVEFDSMAALVSVATGLIGTLVGAAIAWFVGRRQYRLEATSIMHREFNAPEMTHSRNLAGKTVRQQYPKNFDVIRTTLDPEETQHVWNVMYFYQRLWLAIKYQNIHKKYVCEMFGENFYWWYIKSYQVQLVAPEGEKREKEQKKGEQGLNWQAARHIEELWNWFEKEADRNDSERWRKRANEMSDPI